MSRLAATLALIAALSGAGCGPQHHIKLPDGDPCTTTVSAGPSASDVTAALAAAKPGTCVVAAPGTYSVAFSVPASVVFAADVGSAVTVTGDAASDAAITLGAGATLSGIHVEPASRIGVLLDGGGAQLLDVNITGAPSFGVVAWCEDDCLVIPASTLNNVELTNNGVGLWVHGALVHVVGGKVSGSQSLGLASGYGVVASDGASLEMTDTVVEANQELGVLVDGALGTQATLSNVTVQNNLGRGVWAQGLLGTAAAPKLKLNTCTVQGNKLVGVGVRNSQGIAIAGGRVASTVMGQATSMPGVLVDVGDGVGLFENTADVLVDSVALESNGRSQVLVDLGSTGLKVSNSTVTAQSGQLGIVVQHTVATVDAPMITVPPVGMELPISAPLLGVPTR